MKTPVVLSMMLCFLAIGCSVATERTTHSQESDQKMNQIVQPSIKTVTSSYDFFETVSRVVAAIEKRPLKLFAQIDHSAGAAKAELSLPPSMLFIFGNPQGGTPLMARNPQMGIVLPLKMHVYQEGDSVKVSYTDIAMEAKAHGLDSTQMPIPKIGEMLEGLATEVVSK